MKTSEMVIVKLPDVTVKRSPTRDILLGYFYTLCACKTPTHSELAVQTNQRTTTAVKIKSMLRAVIALPYKFLVHKTAI